MRDQDSPEQETTREPSGALLQRSILQPILELLRHGVTPERLALSLALGASLGVFPAVGASTLLCAIVALALGLNLPAIQLANYLVYPAQLAMLLPFFRLGERLFHAERLPLSLQQILAMSKANPEQTVKLLWTTTWHAIVVWAAIAPVAAGFIYIALLPLLRRGVRETREAV